MIQFLHNGFTYRTNGDASIVEGHDGKKWNRTHSLGVRDAALQAIKLRQIGERIGTRGGTYKPPWLVTEDEPSKKKSKKPSQHHATKKSPAQLDREIAEALTAGSGSSTPFEVAKAESALLEKEVDAASAALQVFPRGPMGLVSEATPEYRAAKARFQKAFARLRAFNAVFTKRFAKELRAERSQRYAERTRGTR